MFREKFRLIGEPYEEGDPGDVLEVNHNYSFGSFSLTMFIDDPEDETCAGIRLTRAKAIALRDEIDRRLQLDANLQTSFEEHHG